MAEFPTFPFRKMEMFKCAYLILTYLRSPYGHGMIQFLSIKRHEKDGGACDSVRLEDSKLS